MKTKSTLLWCVVLGVVLATTSGVGCARAPAPSDTLRLAIASPPEALDPRFATSAVAMRLAALVAPPLVTIGDDLRPHPYLAETLAHPDPLTWIVKLRAGLRFHDGAPVTAADVRATILSMKDPRTASPHAAKLAPIKDVVVVDERTARIELAAPYPPLLVDLNGYGIVHVEGAGTRMAPVGAGPYRVVHGLDGDERIALAAWDGGPEVPRIPRIDVRVVRDNTTRLLELEDGRIDLVVGEVLPTDIDAIAGRSDLAVERAPGLGWSYLALNVRGANGALRDPRVRRALALALDVDGIIATKLRGRAARATGMLPAGHWAKDVDERPMPYDPNEARRLIDEVARESGARVHVTLATTTDRLRRATALIFAEQWRAIGVDVDVEVRDWSALYEDIQKGAFDAFSAKWVPVLEPDLMHWVFASSSIPRPGTAGGNRAGYADADVDGWLDAARTVDEEAERAPLYVKAQQRVARDLPMIPLWFEDELAIRSTRVVDFTLGPTASLLPLARAALDDALGGHGGPPPPTRAGAP